jgi:MoxR-like ATPase
MQPVKDLRQRLLTEVGKVFFGQVRVMDYCLIALLCEGHVLLEGVPGVAKTLLARSLASALSLDFKRVQFTPDLMPADIIGTNIFNFNANQFVLRKGPVFTSLLLADEINRTPPKTQAALLEAMQERQVTIDGTTYRLAEPFLVVATQNPIEHEGTYPLPEAQLDRFLFKVNIEYPTPEIEAQIVTEYSGQRNIREMEKLGVQKVAGAEELKAATALVKSVRIEPPVVKYVVDVVRATRESPHVHTGSSPRAGTMLAIASKALAALSGRDFVTPEDVKKMVPATLRHRLVLAPASEIEGMSPDRVLEEVLTKVEVPR